MEVTTLSKSTTFRVPRGVTLSCAEGDDGRATRGMQKSKIKSVRTRYLIQIMM